ncbi:MAG: contact-dependent growth inhibition system immunity protein [Methylovirgula sp.]
MKPTGIPFAKSATIHKSEKFISIEPLSGASGLRYREDESYRTYLEPEAPNEVLGQVLLAALDRSRFVAPSEREFYKPDRAVRVYENWQKDFMARYGYKSMRNAYENMDWCIAKMSDGTISIQPHGRDKPGYWKSLPPDQTVVIPAMTNAAIVGAALRLALDRCE